ncbi:phage holin [Neptuniibacter sp.]|uniref:phage holin n=1 Tax=Neptuniibacter sp. TaxID=1962643 RepID=UPI002602C5EE|nr:phage holin [Neptuniibacter sp.]MCP4597781.1 lysis protein [Neptuniibacter sp.]
MNIDHPSALAAKVASGASYTVSTGLVAGDALQFLNANYGAIGVFIGVATFAVNWYYKRQEIQILAKQSCDQ